MNTAPSSEEDLPADRRRRERMVRVLSSDCRDPRVRQAMMTLPRHLFLPVGMRASAYDDSASPIGSGQTISQPRMVARMLDLLRVAPGDRVLDVGSGSGYTAALLAMLAAPGPVLAIERQGALVAEARPRLARWAPTVELRHADGLAVGDGIFDVIHVGAACAERPDNLIAHLAPGGRLVVPIGPHSGVQRLLLIDGDSETWLDEVLFVPGLPGVVP